MSDLSALSFPFDDGNVVRFVGSPDVPEWVGADIVNILYPSAIQNKNQSTYLSRVPEEWKGSKQIATPGGNQFVTTLFEAGLYSLIARSDSPIAVRFQKWIYEDVLPSIRKTGSYSIEQPGSATVLPPPSREKLENIRLGMDLLYELGGIDERTQLALRDIVRDVLLEDKLKKPALPSGGRAEWPVSDRARQLGYNSNRTQLQSIGRTVAKLYRLRHNGEKPPEREQFVDGTTRMVKCYGENDLDILDQAIVLIMEPPSQLPPAIDDDEF
jgi:prophage antirepressor-like protein